MLFNPKTHIRNMIGNAIALPLIRIKDVVGTGVEGVWNAGKINSMKKVAEQLKTAKTIDEKIFLLEKADTTTEYALLVNREMEKRDTDYKKNVWLNNQIEHLNKRIKNNEGILRTKSVVINKEIAEFTKEDTAQMVDVLLASGGLSGAHTNSFKDFQKMFGLKPLEELRKWNIKMLEGEDAIFLKIHYNYALGTMLSQSGLSISDIREANNALISQNGYAMSKNQNIILAARKYAIQEAQRATYREFSKTADLINQASKIKGIGVVVEGVIPFKKTPINLVKVGMRYSPVGLVQGITKMLTQVKSGKVTASEAIDQFCSGLTGSAVCLVGYLMAQAGILVGKGNEDNEDKLRKQAGEQNYAFQIGKFSYTLDWAVPACLPLFLGVEGYKIWKDDGEKGFNKFYNAILKIGNPVFNLTIFNGISEAIKASSYDKEVSAVATFGKTAFWNLASQPLPVLLGQVARTLSSERQTTRTSEAGNSAFIPKDAQYFLQSIANKIPVNSDKKQPYLDMWGNPEVTPNVLFRAIENFVSPGYISNPEKDEVATKLANLQAKESRIGLTPTLIKKSLVKSPHTYNLSSAQQTELIRLVGAAQYKAAAEFVIKKKPYKLTYKDWKNTPHTIYITFDGKVKNYSSIGDKKGIQRWSDDELRAKAIDNAMKDAYDSVTSKYIKDNFMK